VIEKCKINR